MNFIPTNEYREISMYSGLNSVQTGATDKLYSDGLESDGVCILIKLKCRKY